ncbi:MAG: hypothetical protein QOE79_1273 [Sphingomonadales bacterium]|jgi:hypothetical protein|nr:hypothetical protein [Sphingomonadales bacterium]
MSPYFLAFAAALAAPPPASAPMLPPSAAPAAAPSAPLHVTGRTTGDPKIIGDALGEVQHFAGGHILNCGDVSAVAATPMPRGWVPSDPNFRLGPRGARYERWDVTMCGKVEPFLLVFWKDKSGPAYTVGHPFPKEPAAPHR